MSCQLSHKGSLGTLIITNVRVVWYAEMNDHFNISLPFLQIKQVRVRSSRFGEALVLATHEGPGGGGYVLGFRVDPAERLQSVTKELSALHRGIVRDPDFGVELDLGVPVAPSQHQQQEVREVQEIDDRPNEMSDALVNYCSSAESADKCGPVSFCLELGLAVETPRDGFTIRSLWDVLNSDL
ncbi:hypothetical protein B566_EDAN012608 [Ephemera danica]|nr:hypothetical protein B566_EDAN012608 [Ephemera danica]